MHARKISRVIIWLSIFSVSVSSFAVKDVYRDFQKKIESLEISLKKEKDISKRYEVFLKMYQELSDLRAKGPRASLSQELDMGLFMDTLSYLPEKNSFQANKCLEYKKEVKTMATTYDGKKEPFEDRARAIVDLICR